MSDVSALIIWALSMFPVTSMIKMVLHPAG